MTDQELKDLVASFAIDRKEIADMQKEVVAIQKETARRMEENAAMQKETDRKMREFEEKVEKLSGKYGGLSDNVGYHTEQFFQSVFLRKLEFGGIKYDEMIPNLAYKGKNDKVEFDIALVNGKCVALIEVKNRIHPKNVKELAEERIEKFRKYFREFDGYDVYLGIAGFSLCNEVLERASSYGIGIVRQVGEGVEMEAGNLKAY